MDVAKQENNLVYACTFFYVNFIYSIKVIKASPDWLKYDQPQLYSICMYPQLVLLITEDIQWDIENMMAKTSFWKPKWNKN